MGKCFFTKAESFDEAMRIVWFIRNKGYEGVQNDSMRYVNTRIETMLEENMIHNKNYVYVGCNSFQIVVGKCKRRLRGMGFKYIEKVRVFREILPECKY